MQYALVTANKANIIEIFDYEPILFRYKNIDENRLFKSELINYDIYQIDDNIPSEYNDILKYKLTEKDYDDWIIDATNCIILKQYDIIEYDFYESKEILKKLITKKRYEIETQGIIYNNIPVSTDRETQNMINSALFVLKNKIKKILDWKISNNDWIEIDYDILKNLSNCIIDYIEKCFNTEMEFYTIVDGIDNYDDLKNLNINDNWPSNIYNV